MNYSVTQNGKPLDPSLYTIDEENNLVLDFSNANGWTFNTGYHCYFRTDFGCY